MTQFLVVGEALIDVIVSADGTTRKHVGGSPANVAFGLAVLTVGIWLLMKYGSRMNQRFLRDIAGYNLNAASGFLTTLAEFEVDYSPQERSSIREYSPDAKISKSNPRSPKSENCDCACRQRNI